MKKRNRSKFLIVSSILAGVTTFAAVALANNVKASAENEDVSFEMMYGASLRADNPDATEMGLRFKVQFDKEHYDKIKGDANLHVAIIPYTYYTAWQASDMELYPWLEETYGLGKFLDLQIPDSKVYALEGTDNYAANAVMSNVRFNNLYREFVGVAYIQDGDTYEYAALNEEDNVRSVMWVADKAYQDEEDYAKYSEFLQNTLDKGMYSAYGVKYDNVTGNYAYNGETYTYNELKNIVNVEDSTLSLSDTTVFLGAKTQLKPTIKFKDGFEYEKDGFYTWESSNTGVATVDEKGVLTPLAAGQTTVRVKAIGGQFEASCTVTVESKATVVISEDVAFFAQGNAGMWAHNTGAATVDLTGVPFNVSDIQKVTCNEKEITFSVSGNNVILTDAPGGDQLYTFETSEAKYVLGGCIYGLAISTVEDLETWRNNEYYAYAVLLNDIDYNGATLSVAAKNNVCGTLDGRGYSISNFTYTQGFVQGLWTNSAIKNLQILNATQDCSFKTNPDYGVFGYGIRGAIENVYLQVTTTNLAGEHYGVMGHALYDVGAMKNTITNITGTGAHYVLMVCNATEDNYQNNYLCYGGGYTAHFSGTNAAGNGGRDGNWNTQMDWLFSVANPSLESLGGYWNNDGATSTVDMNPWGKFALTKTVVDVEDVLLAQGNSNKWSYDTGAATLTIAGADFSAVESVAIDGEAFANYTASGATVTLNNVAGGDHAVTIETATHIYNATVCVYVVGISTVEELNTWRNTEQYSYAVLLNDIDYQGATLANGGNILSTLDGRGYTISNFTVTQSFVNRLYAAESAIKNVYFKNVTQDCSGWTGGVDRGVLGQWNNGTLENVYLQVHTTNLSGEHYGVLCYGMDTGSKIKNVVVEVTSDSTKFHYIMMQDYALAAGNSVGVVGSYANGATESADAAWGVNSGFHQQLSWMIAEEANDELLSFTSPYWVLDTAARTITMKPVKFTFVAEEGPVEPGQPEVVEIEKVKLSETYYNEKGMLDLTNSGIAASAVTAVTCNGEAVEFTANGNALTVAAQTNGTEYTYVITTSTTAYTLNVLACDVAISTADEFVAWATTATEGSLINNYAVLTKDIKLDGSVISGASLYGTFDGRGYSIYNLTTLGTKGLFTSLNSGTFKNVQLINYTQDCNNAKATQGLFGDWTSGTVENLLIQGQIINLGANVHDGVLLHYVTGGTYKNIVAYLESDGTAYHYGLSMGGSGTPTASNIHFVSSSAVFNTLFDENGTFGTTENNGSYASEAAMLAAVDFSTWAEPWATDENGAPYMSEVQLKQVVLPSCGFERANGKVAVNLTEFGIQDAVTKITVGGANTAYELNGKNPVFAVEEGEYQLSIYTKWVQYHIEAFFCDSFPTEKLATTFLAQEVDGNASIDLSESGVDLSKIKSVSCGGVNISFSVTGNNLVLTGAPYGDQTYVLATIGKRYVLEGCVYQNALSTVEDVDLWRNNSMPGYSVLLNDIDYQGATITEGGFITSKTLDGRGYKISNFTMKNFVTRLYDNNAVVKNVYFDDVTQDCSSWEGGIDQGLFGNWHSGVIENVYLNVTTTNMNGEHYGVLFYGTEANAVVRNVVVEIESECVKENGDPQAHYVHMQDDAAGTVVENLVGSGLNVGEGGKVGYTGAASGFHQYLNWMIIEEANDELLSFTSPYWVIDTAANTITMLPLAETKPAEVEDGYLVKDGVSAYRIVLDIDNTSSEYSTAVTELKTLFKEATGVELRSISEANVVYSDDEKYISLGNTSYASAANVYASADLGAQGFAIVTRGQSIFIVGESQGVQYGVYELLHQLFNFEQYTKEIYTLNTGVTTLELPTLDIEDKPAIENRIAFSGVQRVDKTSRERMRTTNSEEVMMNKGAAHNMILHIVPFDTYYATNPTWFSSKTKSSDTYATTQLCYTAGGYGSDNYNAMKAVAVANIKQIILENPQANLMSLTQMDTSIEDNKWCACSGCQAIMAQYGGAQAATQIVFINDVVTEVRAWLQTSQAGREVQFVTFAYGDTEDAPTGLNLHEDVSIWIAPIRYRTGESENDLYTMFDKWENVTSSVVVWEYGVYFSNYLIPYNNFGELQTLIQACRDNKAKYLWIQGNWNNTQNTGFDSLKAYLISKLMWNPDANVTELTNNYFNAVYGEAAETMKSVYEAMLAKSASVSKDIYANANDDNIISVWNSDSYLENQLAALDNALGMIDKEADPVRYNAILCETISFRYLYRENNKKSFWQGGGKLDYSATNWSNTFATDVANLGFTMLSENDNISTYS